MMMDSEDEMHDATDVYSLVVLFRSDTEIASDDDTDDDDYGVIDDTDDDNFGVIVYTDDSHHSTLHRQQQNYTILNMEDISQRQEADITNISTLLSISRVYATILLIHYNWNVDDVHNAWFTDEEHVRRKIGLLEGPVIQIPNVNELRCGICLEFHPPDTMNAATCGHLFCSSCWGGYVSTSINDGPGCLLLRCPVEACGAAVGQDMINLLASDEDRQKYSCFLLRSYIEDNRKTKWCPAPGCDCAVEFVIGSESYDVFCNCTHSFCWNCTEEAHRPVDCSTVAKWILKNSDVSNASWKFVNSKPCPKCNWSIERNEGCMHMKCPPPCKFEFCWLCLGKWSDDGETTGGHYDCKSYRRALLEKAYIETEHKKETVAKDLERYAYYYERRATSQSSMLEAMENLQQAQSVQIGELHAKLITEAWRTIIECRRVLKWTYVHGYYLVGVELAKIRFFQHRQVLAEYYLQKLHQCAVKELQGYLNADVSSKELNENYTKLAGLTRIARNQFQNLVQDLEDGLPDVESQGACSKSQSSRNRDESGLSGVVDVESQGACSKSRGSSQILHSLAVSSFS